MTAQTVLALMPPLSRGVTGITVHTGTYSYASPVKQEDPEELQCIQGLLQMERKQGTD